MRFVSNPQDLVSGDYYWICPKGGNPFPTIACLILDEDCGWHVDFGPNSQPLHDYLVGDRIAEPEIIEIHGVRFKRKSRAYAFHPLNDEDPS